MWKYPQMIVALTNVNATFGKKRYYSSISTGGSIPMDEIERVLRTRLGIKDDTLVQRGLDVSYVRYISKGEYLARQDDVFPGVAFLIEGLMRFYYIDSSGREHTDCFCEDSVYPITPVIDLDMPLSVNIQALEDSSVVVIPTTLVRTLLENNVDVIRTYNQMLKTSLAQNWEDKRALHQFDALARYEWFLCRYEGLIDRIPHIHVASFLGISPVTLSRLRRKKKIEVGERE